MNRKMHSACCGEIPFSELLPSCLAEYYIPTAPFSSASWEQGDCLLQEMDWEVKIRYSNYLLRKKDTLRLVEDQPLLSLQFILSNSFYGSWEGIGPRVDHESSCNLYYLPYVDQRLEVTGGRIYSKIDIQFPPSLLRELAPYFPLLDPFLEKMDRGEAVLLHEANRLADTEMLNSIREVLQNPFQDEVRKLYAEAKGIQILIKTMEAFVRQKGAPSRLTPYETEQVYQVKDFLLRHLDVPVSLGELARSVGANKFKLTMAFREVYHATVFEYLLRMRMERAEILLLETTEPVEAIAFMTGYNDVFGFSKAFKRHFGTSPRTYRIQKLFTSGRL